MKVPHHSTSSVSFGFTIVELLVVIVIIGILATITIVSYTGISKKATVASIQTDLDSAYKKFKMYQVENSGYPTNIELNCTTASVSTNICLKPSANNQYNLSVNNSVSTNQTFCLAILNTSINTTYNINQDGTQTQGACPTYTLTIIAGANGTVNTGGSYAPGSSQTITATPNLVYLFNNWTGDAGCSGLASHAITMDSDKTCTANFVADPNWISGIAATVLAGKYVRNANLGSFYTFKTTNTAITAPQGVVGGDPNYPAAMSLVSPQANSAVDFSAYPAQNACKAVGGRLPNAQELTAIYNGKVTYGNNFPAAYYWSSTEAGSSSATVVYIAGFTQVSSDIKTGTVYYTRCVAG